MSKTSATLLGIVGLFIAATLVLPLRWSVTESTGSDVIPQISLTPTPVVRHYALSPKGPPPKASCGKTAHHNKRKSPDTLPEKTDDPPASPKIIEAELAPAKNTSQARDWVDATPRSVGDVYQMSIAIGPWTTRAECDAKLPAALQEALDRYVEACLGEEVRQRIVLPDDYLRQLIKDQREEVSEHSFGPMTTLHVLLEFDRKAKDRVLDELRRTKVAGRLWLAGFGWVVWLALLGGVYGYLRISGSRKSG